MTADTRLHVPFYKRLSIQLAVLCAVGFFLYDYFEPNLHDVVLRAFGFPSLDAEVWVIDKDAGRSQGGFQDEFHGESTVEDYDEDLPEDAVVMSEEEVAAEERLQELVTYCVPVVIGVLIAVLISRLVTGRVTRLARQASTPVAAGELPGPFNAKGKDEIALLAATMNSMRDRVAGLLTDMAEIITCINTQSP